jgi:hypothetical protein
MGLSFASLIFVLSLIDNNSFGAMDVVFPLIFGTLFGITWTNATKHEKLKNKYSNFAEWNSGAILCSGMGSLIDANHSERKGFILLTRDAVIFNPNDANDETTKIKLSDTTPQIDKSWVGFLKMPTGIQLTNERSVKLAKFPRYWLEKIKNIRSGAGSRNE